MKLECLRSLAEDVTIVGGLGDAATLLLCMLRNWITLGAIGMAPVMSPLHTLC